MRKFMKGMPGFIEHVVDRSGAPGAFTARHERQRPAAQAAGYDRRLPY
jgi:hypothetical protein